MPRSFTIIKYIICLGYTSPQISDVLIVGLIDPHSVITGSFCVAVPSSQTPEHKELSTAVTPTHNPCQCVNFFILFRYENSQLHLD